MSRPGATDEARGKSRYLPREHGATAMLLTPVVCAGLLARTWCWAELATLVAAFAALAAKDPLVVLVRQRLVWKTPRPETRVAARWFAGWLALLAGSGLVLLASWPLTAALGMGAGVVVFSALAIWVNVKNRQRSTLFQIASAAALTSSSLATSLSARGAIAGWCWELWALLAMQATAGILVVHARLDARIALRGTRPASLQFRRAAQATLAVLLGAACGAAVLRRWWIALALVAAVAGYAYDLRCQRDREALQMPLMRVGRRALALASIYAVLVVVGLW